MDAPFGHKLEMEMLILLFISLWILQRNTVSADSIIHIGKTHTRGFFLALLCGALAVGEMHSAAWLKHSLPTWKEKQIDVVADMKGD